MLPIRCENCQAEYPSQGVPYRCPSCGGIFNLILPLSFSQADIDNRFRDMRRYVALYGLPHYTEYYSLGEGGTPLLQDKIDNRPVYLKLEYANPTGSYKDRGSSVLVSHLVSRGVTQAVEDSSGNAGASFAAYAARAGINAKIFAPESASGPKLSQRDVPSSAYSGTATSADHRPCTGDKPARIA